MSRRHISAGDQFINLKVLSIRDNPEGGSPLATVECRCGNEVELSTNRLTGSCVQRYCGKDCGVLAEEKKARGGSLSKAQAARAVSIQKKKETLMITLKQKEEEILALKAEVSALRQALEPMTEPAGLDEKTIEIRLPLPVWARWSLRASRVGRSLPVFLSQYFTASLAYDKNHEKQKEAELT